MSIEFNNGLVSIHASVKDATRKDEILSNPSLVSIHASVKDATRKGVVT